MLNKLEAKALFALRLSVGWMMFYAGITKVLDPSWTAIGYGMSAKTFPGLYEFLVSPGNIGWINFVNEWGLTLLGISLILGIGVRLSSVLGAFLMFSYYLPILKFPYVGHGYLVDEHIVYILVLVFFAVARAGRYYGLEKWFSKTFLKRASKFQKYWG